MILVFPVCTVPSLQSALVVFGVTAFLTDLAVFLTSIAVGFCFVRLRGVGPELVWWENLKTRLQPKPKFKVVPKSVLPRRDDDDLSEAVDPILDKIARSGIASLTPNERRILDRARDRLLKGSK